MKEQWVKWKGWWSQLKLREQQALMLGACAIAIFMLYEFVASPILTHLSIMRQRIVSEQKKLVWMQSADRTLQQMQGQHRIRNEITSPVMLMGLLQKKIDDAKLATLLTQLKQTSNESVQMNFQKIDFDKLIALLVAITKEYQISITEMNVMTENSPGVVSAEVVLSIH